MAKTETPVTVREPEGLPPSETVRISRIYPRWVKPLLLALAGTAAVGTVYGVYSWVRGFDPPPPKEPVPISTPYNGNHVVIPPVIGLSTPTPTAESTPAPKETPVVTPVPPTLTPTSTPVKNELDRFLEDPRVSAKFTEQDFRTARTLGKLFNAMVTQGNISGYENYPPWSMYESEEERIGLWLHYYGLIRDGKSVYDLREESIQKLFPNSEDQETFYRGLWIKSAGDLKFYKTLYNEILESYKNTDSGEHRLARIAYEEWLLDRANNGWKNTVESFRKVDRVLSSDTEFGGKWDFLKYIWGYTNSQTQRWGSEIAAYHTLDSAYGAFGVPVFFPDSAVGCITDESYRHHSEFAVPIPSYLFDKLAREIPEEIVRFKGSAISLFSMKSGMEKDGYKFLFQYWPYWEVKTTSSKC